MAGETKKELNSIQENLNVIDGYIEFEIEKGSEYFITMSNLELLNETKQPTNIFTILSIVELVIIIGLIILYFIKLKPKKNI